MADLTDVVPGALLEGDMIILRLQDLPAPAWQRLGSGCLTNLLGIQRGARNFGFHHVQPLWPVLNLQRWDLWHASPT